MSTATDTPASPGALLPLGPEHREHLQVVPRLAHEERLQRAALVSEAEFLYDPAENLDAIKTPSLWIWGDADTIIPLRESVAGVRKSRAHPMPELLVLPKAGPSFTVSTTAIPQLAEGYPDAVIRWINGLSR